MSYIPLRYLAEGIGAEVTWDNEVQSVWVKAGSDKMQFWIGKDYMELNGMKKTIGSKVFVNTDGRTVLPLRFITVLLGRDVKWGQQDRSITLTKSVQ